MEDHCPGIVRRHIKHDEASISTALKQSSDLSGFAAENWCNLTHLFCVTEGDNLKRNRKANLCFCHQSAKHGSHLLKAQRGVAPAVLARISDHGKVWGAYLNPLRLARGSVRLKDERER